MRSGTRCDGSVARVVRGAPLLLRRARGYAPLAILLPCEAPRPILACGGELKSAFALVRQRDAFLSQHLGDLADERAWRAWLDAVAHWQRLLDFSPRVVAHDLHPGYRSTAYAQAQAAMEMEALAEPEADRAYSARLGDTDGRIVVRTADLVGGVVEDLLAGTKPERIASRFHAALAEVITQVCARIRERTGLARVALSGGVFQNMRLLRAAVARLEQEGFVVYTHHQVPPNDGGLALGQAAVAARLVAGRGDA